MLYEVVLSVTFAVVWVKVVALGAQHPDRRFDPQLERLLERALSNPTIASIVQLSVHDCIQAVRLLLYRHLYLPNRSTISLAVGCCRNCLFRISGRQPCPPFACDCCCFRLGGQDRDTEYSAACTCSFTASPSSWCRLCVSTYIESQVSDSHSAKPVCMASRKCVLDDRLVRTRLSPSAIRLLDRNQILLAAAEKLAEQSSGAKDINNQQQRGKKEALWHCPSPNCDYICFVSTRTSRTSNTPWLFRTNLLGFNDKRKIRCPSCCIASCQFCSKVWTRGRLDHEGLSCERYATQLSSEDGDSDRAFQLYRQHNRNAVQVCRAPHCNFVIEKNEGCIHMTCQCKYQFCWVCGDEWSPQHSYFCRKRPPQEDNNNNDTNGGSWFTSWFR
jgi:IBR domain, a half RING-finger domain